MTRPAGHLTFTDPELATRARQRLISAMAGVVAEEGLRAMTVGVVCRRAGMSRRTFYAVFKDLDACFAAGVAQAFDELLAAADGAAAAAIGGEPWEARAARIVTALVSAFARDGTLAHLCLVEARSAGPAGHTIRRDALAHLARTLADGAVLDDEALRQATALGAVVAVLELADERGRRRPDGGCPDDLAASAVYLALAPFSGRRVASDWSQRAASLPLPPAPRTTRVAQLRIAAGVTPLTRRTLLHLDENPGASNIDIARAVGVAHQSQISRHLARLEREGVALRHRDGRSNAWRLTARGHALADQVR